MWPFTSSPAAPPTPTPIDPSPSSSAPSADKCPVDHTTRSAWLAAQSSSSPNAPHPFHPTSASGSSSSGGLSQDRVISSIPRAPPPSSSSSSSPNGGEGHNLPELQKDSEGRWIYPSEQQFFNAMLRKNHNPQARDMKTVVPIHNAVNEKAWEEILMWESKIEGSERCGGPRLISFVGKPRERTPKAWIKTALGYTPPFDRHDWLIDRCGTQVRYVIDFYTGKSGLGDDASKMSFYLDVRPAVDNWEGIRTRAAGWWS
ncbi:hypothetical protein I302_105671 [Kwoniella bestiolae CBS 10118]|uniref:Holocytochrome c-type synthase n=1 Tax=Kwoniella bestiolae CBS 10118 TaxID=1296100 RepID=A0A1B9G1T6_9TREE|nr:cytochrome c heme-lyase [Kwoniella bestiolae CBS 10118]OCF24979.1 cytochrome c heme-lyase [Kwoniella bestiolae CBS 10118]